MRRTRALWLASIALAAEPAAADPQIVTSAGPQDVDVTIYRAPGRSFDSAWDLEWLDGYALISETRRVAIPAGESDLRFEGVAGGILPQSAILTGFPEGIVERNRDAYLLSPESLLDRSLGRRVHLRRTSPATGRVREEDAVIRSGADGAVVLETPEGFEALRCTGLPETPVYDRVPAGLSARPTLSVRARSSRPFSATITLSYLADGFDWQANYVATLSSDGSHLDLFAWLTLASSDETSFRDANAQAVAGRPNRERIDPDPAEGRPLELHCWPQARTSDIPLEVPPPPPPRSVPPDLINNLPTPMTSVSAEEIVVTGARARQEELGDLKLYRIEEPVTVAAHSQKQVAFLVRPRVAVRTVYRQWRDANDDGDANDAQPVRRLLITRNRREERLGVPLPGGAVTLFTAGDRPILLGEGSIQDHAVGEDVEIDVGEASGVASRLEEVDSGDHWEEHLLSVTNDHDMPVRYEADLWVNDDQILRARGPVERRNGRPLWVATIPAHGSASLRYRVVNRGR